MHRKLLNSKTSLNSPWIKGQWPQLNQQKKHMHFSYIELWVELLESIDVSKAIGDQPQICHKRVF